MRARQVMERAKVLSAVPLTLNSIAVLGYSFSSTAQGKFYGGKEDDLSCEHLRLNLSVKVFRLLA